MLSWAWRKGGVRAIKSMKYLAIIFLIIFIIGSMDVGMISGQELAVILGVGLLLLFNVFSVKKIARLTQSA